MKKKFLFILLLFSIGSCTYFEKKNYAEADEAKLNMMDTDRAFSKMSEEKGMKTAFLNFIDSNGVLLKANNMPLLGADAIDYLIRQNDSTYTLKWEPKSGMVAKSGELGYTYGIYALKPTDKDTMLYGTYISIWKKQSDSTWKFILDSGNEGIGKEE